MQEETIIVLGAGESGVGAAILAQKQGYKVFVSDAGVIAADYKNILEKYSINFSSWISGKKP